MSSREFFRPYTKVMNLSACDPSTVLLTDTAGNDLECNYVTVEAVSGAGSSWFLAVPSGTNVLHSGATQPHASALSGTVNLSGVNGLISSNNGGSVVFGFADYDKTTAIILSQADLTDVTYVISYGNVNVANIQQDNRNNIGN